MHRIGFSLLVHLLLLLSLRLLLLIQERLLELVQSGAVFSLCWDIATTLGRRGLSPSEPHPQPKPQPSGLEPVCLISSASHASGACPCQASAAGPTPSTGSSLPSWRQHIGTILQKTRGSSPTTTLTLRAGQSTSTGKSPAAGRSLEGALPARVWPCFAQSPCTGGQQTPSSTGSRSCPVRSPATWSRTPWGAGCCTPAQCTCSRRPSCLCCCRARPGWWKR
uniref:Secreted protein n=1 Tax=Ursus maritimus TaxID=29073 RepID=A0A452UER7_URSMA